MKLFTYSHRHQSAEFAHRFAKLRQIVFWFCSWALDVWGRQGAQQSFYGAQQAECDCVCLFLDIRHKHIQIQIMNWWHAGKYLHIHTKPHVICIRITIELMENSAKKHLHIRQNTINIELLEHTRTNEARKDEKIIAHKQRGRNSSREKYAKPSENQSFSQGCDWLLFRMFQAQLRAERRHWHSLENVCTTT